MNDLRLIAIWQAFAEAESHLIDAISAVRGDPAADIRKALDNAATESVKATTDIRQILSEWVEGNEEPP